MKLLYLLLISLITSKAIAQNITAKYAVTETIYYTDKNGNKAAAPILKFDGFFYGNGHTYISFLKPLYLNDYPDGSIIVEQSPDNVFRSVGLIMDTIQGIDYNSLDSLIYRCRFQKNPEGLTSNTKFDFELGYQKWEILPETKTIQGLQCQRAKRYDPYRGNMLVNDVWFCADLTVPVSFDNCLGLPGLIVEGTNLGTNTFYELQYYNLNMAIPEQIFWPNEFTEMFRIVAKKIVKKW